MGPAGAAVLGNVLVSQVSEIVSVVNVIPYPLVGQVDRLQGLPHVLFNGFLALDSARGSCAVFHGKSCTEQKCDDEDRSSSHNFYNIIIFALIIMSIQIYAHY